MQFPVSPRATLNSSASCTHSLSLSKLIRVLRINLLLHNNDSYWWIRSILNNFTYFHVSYFLIQILKYNTNIINESTFINGTLENILLFFRDFKFSRLVYTFNLLRHIAHIMIIVYYKQIKWLDYWLLQLLSITLLLNSRNSQFFIRCWDE